MPTDSRQLSYRPLVVAGVLIALVATLAWASKVLIPIALGVLLTFILNPAVAWLQGRGLRRVPAVLLVGVTTVIVIVCLLTALTFQLRDLAGELPQHKDQITTKVRDLIGRGPGVLTGLTRMLDEISVELQGPHQDVAGEAARPVPVRVQSDRLPTFGVLAGLLAGPLASTLGSIGLVTALTISMLLMREDLRNRLFLLLGDGNLTSTTRALDEVSWRISRYLVIQVILNASFGTVFGLGLALIGVRYAFVWGVLAAVLRFVPYIGTWLAAVFPVLVSLAVEGWTQSILVVAYVLVLGVAANNVLEPMLVSRSTGVTPIALVVATAFWTWLWGPIGLILSTPLTVCLSVVARYVPSLRFLDILLGSAAPLGRDLKFYQRLLAHDEAEAADLVEDYLTEHTPEELFDDVIAPALGRARQDRERGHLSAEELAHLVRAVRELVEAALGEADPGPVEPAVGVIGCSAHDEMDALMLELLGRLLPARLEVVGAGATAAEVLERVGEDQPAVVCLGCLPPAGTARARYLCKRLQARHPRLPLVACLWGTGDREHLSDQLRQAGAGAVATSFAQARAGIVPLLQLAAHLEPV